MSRVRFASLSVIALASLAACSDGPVDARSAGLPSSTNPVMATGADEVVPGEVLVKLKAGATLDEVFGEARVGRGAHGFRDAFDVAVTGEGNERAMAARLAADPRVEWAEPNYIRHVNAVGPRLWSLSNPGGMNMKFSSGTSVGAFLPAAYAALADADIDANFTATCQVASCPDIVVGSIDTGADFSNPELSGRLIAGKDWIDGDMNPADIAAEGHGSHTAGTVGGANISAVGVTGIASHVKVYVQRVCSTSGCPSSAIINALNAAASYRDAAGKPLVAVNFSIGGSVESAGEKTAIQAMTTNGTLFVASSGNSGTSTVGCPACDVNAVSVGATDWRDARTSYSQYGSGLDLMAPGGNCYSNTTEEGCVFSSAVAGYTGGNTYSSSASGTTIYALNTNLPLTGTNYAYMQGTSMAAPNVTSTFAVVGWATGLRGAALRTRVQSTADHVAGGGATWPNTGYGNGRVNVYRAVFNTATAPQ